MTHVLTRAQVVGVMVAIAGLGQLTFGVWASWSDGRAADAFHANASCDLAVFRRAEPPPDSVCTIGTAGILSLNTFGGKGGLRYNLRLGAEAGASERVSLGSSREASQFWITLRPGQLLRVQRFAAAGYHLTQRIVAVSDGQATMMTLHSPDSGARPNMVNVVLGSTALVVGLLLALRRPPGIRTVA